jgi:hypothetical protein
VIARLLFLTACLTLNDVRDATAQNASPFAPFLNQDSPACVLVSIIEHVAKEFRPVKAETFRFIEAFYVAIPPISRELPPGNRAELATDAQGNVLAFITDGLQSCARFLAPPFLAKMIDQVESGRSQPHSGKDM